KYREGVDESDPKKWKANFRCAMNSLPDVEQIKGKSVNKGQQAVRVYRMMELTTTKDCSEDSGTETEGFTDYKDMSYYYIVEGIAYIVFSHPYPPPHYCGN
ncbi:unnamed protein product, partial [Merluccius merluccius]